MATIDIKLKNELFELYPYKSEAFFFVIKKIEKDKVVVYFDAEEGIIYQKEIVELINRNREKILRKQVPILLLYIERNWELFLPIE